MKIWGLALVIATSTAFAHVGSPDVYLESQAGPYHLLVTVNPPAMIPGVAQVQIRVTSGTVDSITITPIYVNGKDQGLPPAPDSMQKSTGDSGWFAGKVWLMESGVWDLRAQVSGPQGVGNVVVPVPAYARRALPMKPGLGALLLALMLFLAVGIIFIAGAAAREGILAPADKPSPRNLHLGRIAMAVAAVLVVTMLALGNWWWDAQAAELKHTMLYSAPPLEVSYQTGQLTLKMDENYWHQTRKGRWSMGLIPDHGHVMHLFLLRVPDMDRFYHLHPEPIREGMFTAKLPAAPSGSYRVFADIVRGTGFPETMVGQISLPDVAGHALSGDDSAVIAPAFRPSAQPTASSLSDGGQMVWERDGTALKAGEVGWFRFRLENAQHQPIEDLEPYMGMAGHAEFVRSDLSVFAHIHPAGSVPMVSLITAQRESGLVMDHASMDHGSDQKLPAEVSFPYGFPQSGDYRLFVQVKRQGRVETGVFDARVEN
jgi:hypothetical protein